MHETHHTAPQKPIMNEEQSKILIISLLVVTLIVSLYGAFFKKDALWLETLKAGGAANFALTEQIYSSDTYKSQQEQSISKALSMFISGAAQAAPTPTAAATDTTAATVDLSTAQTLEKSKIDALLKNGYYKGNKNARIVIAEYSDFLCPFCQRHYSNQTIEKVLEKYPNDVAMIFKNMPLPQLHPTAPLGARGAECAGKLGGSEKFYAFIDKAFKMNEFTDVNVVDLAKSLGLNVAPFTACYNDASTTAAIQVESEEGQTLFGINGTPGNVVIDRQTGKYFVIAGAYPFEEFDGKVQALLAK